MSIDMSNYIDVAARIATFREKHPHGSLRVMDFPDGRPYMFETVGDDTFIVVVAYAHRTPDDPCPGMGMAWEPFPGRTPYTRNSELQNAETSAWGRAIVATLAADTTVGIASANEVQNRAAENSAPVAAAKPAQTRTAAPAATDGGFVWPYGKDKGKALADTLDESLTWHLANRRPDPGSKWYEKNKEQYAVIYAEAQRRGLVEAEPEVVVV